MRSEHSAGNVLARSHAAAHASHPAAKTLHVTKATPARRHVGPVLVDDAQACKRFANLAMYFW